MNLKLLLPLAAAAALLTACNHRDNTDQGSPTETPSGTTGDATGPTTDSGAKSPDGTTPPDTTTPSTEPAPTDSQPGSPPPGG